MTPIPMTRNASGCCGPRRLPGAGDHRGRARPTGVVVTVSIKDNGRIVIVGASLAGLRAAEALREEGFRGRLTVIGDEPGEPYDRPPLSKQVLAGWVGADGTKPPRMREVDAEWRLGVAATALDRANGFVRLADGSEVEGDRLLIATGVRSRTWPNPEEAALEGVHTLRTSADAAAGRAGRPAAASADHRVRVHRFGGGLGLPRPRPRRHRR